MGPVPGIVPSFGGVGGVLAGWLDGGRMGRLDGGWWWSEAAARAATPPRPGTVDWRREAHDSPQAPCS